MSPTILWDTLKAVLRGKIISITTHIKKLQRQRLSDLQGKLKQIQLSNSRNISSAVKEENKKTQSEIDDIYTQEKKISEKKYLFETQEL